MAMELCEGRSEDSTRGWNVSDAEPGAELGFVFGGVFLGLAGLDWGGLDEGWSGLSEDWGGLGWSLWGAGAGKEKGARDAASQGPHQRL